MYRTCASDKPAYIASATREPVHPDFLGSTEMDRLGTDLRVAVDDNFTDLSNRKCLLLTIGAGNRERFAGFADPRSMCRDVDGLPFTVLRKEPDRLPALVSCQAFFFGQAHWRQGAAQAQPVILGHRRAFDRLAERPGTGNGFADVVTRFCVHGNANRRVIGVIANSRFFNRRAGVLFHKQRISADLEPVARPRLRAVVAFCRTTAFVFVGNQPAIPGGAGNPLCPECRVFRFPAPS